MTLLLQEHCADLLVPALAAIWSSHFNLDRDMAHTFEMEPVYERVREDIAAEANKRRRMQPTRTEPICRG